jgi:spermidine synthase
VAIGDGRTLLRGAGSRKYDYILLDTFLNSYVPFHLTTREFFALIRARLNPGGVLVANFHTVFARSGLLPSLETTIQDVFPSVASLELAAGTTLVMAAAESGAFPGRLRAAARRSPAALAELSERAAGAIRPADPGGRVLTDDRNDTEQRLYETRRLVRVSRPI